MLSCRTASSFKFGLNHELGISCLVQQEKKCPSHELDKKHVKQKLKGSSGGDEKLKSQIFLSIFK